MSVKFIYAWLICQIFKGTIIFDVPVFLHVSLSDSIHRRGKELFHRSER